MTRLRGGAAGAAAMLGMVVLLAGCEGVELPADSEPSGSGPAVSSGRAVSPLDNPDGTKPGLAAITTDADRTKARALIEKVETKGRGPKTGYDRDEFGYAWMDSAPGGIPFSRNGCDTRNDLLQRDGEDVRFRSGSDCVVVSMTLADPYTGKELDWVKSRATAVQIDHVMPLSYDWQMGASRWDKDKREDIANDPLNLIPVDGPTNGSKSDSGPASWLPPNKQIRCSYVVRFAQVSLKYELPVTKADKEMMLRQCGG
ncbi:MULTISPECIES: HNH endonuclease family protein [unclassified Streptomyces]|uniref:HNH endonuclease family protein n=1 Tax=unclassified Streptomyces TaxID=2593676 RepID=UPI00225A115B|nr:MULTISPECIES: HNH endonuclease family protein [unclassified Streptomyces]MCX5333529.1 HNH endonuclease family protein [Streptomyces sp. NBC_00140]MCX5363000.1 HNH endonuclease family protein [Streptomyces sp. NBC_00124]